MTDTCCENGYYRKILQKIINNFKKITRGSINSINNNKTDKKQTITLPWIPKIGPKTKKQIQKCGFRVAFQNLNLKNVLCKKKDKLIPDSHLGVCELKCSCSSVYDSETEK